MANYPDWVMKHKKKGTYINKVGDKYYLYAAHSERVKGTNKVRRVSDGYLGRITLKDGFIPVKSKVKSPVVSYEFGSSFVVLSYTGKIHSGLRRSFSKNGDLVYVCSILFYLFDSYDRDLFTHSYLLFHFPALVFPEFFTQAQITGIERGRRMISDTMKTAFGEELAAAKAAFSILRIVRINEQLYCTESTDSINAFSEKYAIDWGCALWQK